MDTAQPRDFAIVLGISRYGELSDLVGPVRDAEAVLAWLTDPDGGAVPTGNVHVLTDEGATRESVERAFEDVLGRTSSSGGRRLYVYAAGHGYRTDSVDAALVFGDGSRSRPGSAIDLVSFADSFARPGVFEEVVLWADCSRYRWEGNPGRPRWSEDDFGKTPASTFYGFASGVAQEAFAVKDAEAGAHGLFTRALLEGLGGAAANPRGRVDAHTLATFVTRRVEERADELGAPPQVPEFRLGGSVPIVFEEGEGASHPASTAAATQTRPEAAPQAAEGDPAPYSATKEPRGAAKDPEVAETATSPPAPPAPGPEQPPETGAEELAQEASSKTVGEPPDDPEVPSQGFSRRARTGLELGASLAAAADRPIDSVAILSGLLLAASGDDRRDPSRALWDRLVIWADTAEPLDVLAFEETFGVAEVPRKGRRVRPPEGFDDDGRSVLTAARRFAEQLEGKDRIAARHLLLALLRARDPAPRAQGWLEEGGANLEKLRVVLGEALADFWKADPVAAAGMRDILGLPAEPDGEGAAREERPAVPGEPEEPGYEPPRDGFTERAQHGLAFALRLAEAGNAALVDPTRIFVGMMLQSQLEAGGEVGAPAALWQRMSALLGTDDLGLGLRLADELEVGKPPADPGEFLPPPRGMTPEALAVLTTAQENALAISRAHHVAARHLLSALLGPGEASSGVKAYLRESLGLRISELVQGFYNDMAAHGFGEDDPDQWRLRLGLDRAREGSDRELSRRPLAGYAPDHVRLGAVREADDDLRDRLGIEGDVEALSKVAMASDVEPPMSIGLFGDWGSGKTYFMALMHQKVLRLRDVARAAHAGEDKTVYCRDVAQIHFNAWHFIDTNLWASIVTRIFSELARHFDPDGEKPEAWDAALKETEHAGTKLHAASESLGKANEELRKAAEDEKERRRQVEEVDEAIEERRRTPPRLRHYVAAVFRDAEIQPQLKAMSEELGISGLQGSFETLTTELKVARTLSGRIQTVWRELGGSLTRRMAMLGLAVLVIAAPGALAWLLSTEAAEAVRLSLTAGAGLVGLVTNRLVTLRPAFEAADGVLARLEGLHESVVQQATHDLRSERDRLVDLRAVARQRLEAARQRHQRARAEKDAAELLIDRVRTGAFIGDFIREQSQKPDYKEQLGIIDEIRTDLEGLSRLLRHTSSDATETRRLDRIILYIDDLDRCPTERVVEVLQAIHLLLAFELFVVVVGVDSRWLLHALEKEYSAFSGLSGSTTIERLRWRTTPHNYLEKIFQIPFTLRPMGSGGFAELIQHLTGAVPEPGRQRAEEDGQEQAPLDGGPPEGAHEPPEPKKAQLAPVPAPSGRRPSPGAGPAVAVPEYPERAAAGELESGAPEEEAEGEDAPDLGSPEEVGEDAPLEGPEGGESEESEEPEAETLREDRPIDPNPPELKIGGDERQLMQRLDELIPTPRAAKRFVNLYRLIKATIRTEAALAKFMGTPERAGDYQAVMLMLALQAGFPTQAYEVFRHLSLKPRGSWWDFVAGLQPVPDGTSGGTVKSLNLTGLNDAEAEQWRELHRALEAQRPAMTMPDDLRPFVEHATEVARFGFITGRAIAPERGPTSAPPDQPLE